jgi:hypothetical protein
MRSGAKPFRFELSELLARARRTVSGRVGNITLHLPFVDVEVSPKDREKQVAREIVIRLKDRRVLSAQECCDNCIDQALASLQEIRGHLVDKQVELSDMQDGPLYLLTDMMREGIRQFLTYEQLLKRSDSLPPHSPFSDFRRPPDVRQSYFDALELLRGHLSRCLGQVAVIGGMSGPQDGFIAEYRGAWPLDAYVAPKLPAPRDNLDDR